MPSTLWQQMGLDIDGEAAGDRSGISVSLSANGERVAIGAQYNDGNGNNSGHVRVYEYKLDNGIMKWMQMGVVNGLPQDINGEAVGDQSGFSVSLSANGERVAIGALGNDGNGNNSGHVRVYEYNGTSWVQMGLDINGEAAGDNIGFSVSMNANGERVAIGSIFNSSSRGHVRVYNWNGSSWGIMGTDIDGEAAGDYSGQSVSLSADGQRVAIGAYYNDGNGTNNSGHVRVYEYKLDNGIMKWMQMGVVNGLPQDINGEAANDYSGQSVSLSADGQRVAIGATENDGTNRTNSGHVRVYEYKLDGGIMKWQRMGLDIDGEAADDQSGRCVSLSADGQRVAIGANRNDGIINNINDNRGHVRVYQLAATVEVNLNIAVDASGTINIFGQTLPTVDNVIVAQTKLPAAALYSATNSMFEFWEPSDATDTRKAQLAITEGRDWKLLTRKLANGIQGCLEGEFDATLASPFNDAIKYTADVHKKADNFGDLALRSYAHYTLGHVDATAAITNDETFIAAMLARDPQHITTSEDEVDTFSSTAAGTKACANLANLLVKAIAEKDGAGALAIAEQVLGQDASRAMDEDNNQITVDKKQALKFIAGDIIYMNIRLQRPDVVIASTGQKVLDSVLEVKYPADNSGHSENYTLKITLE